MTCSRFLLLALVLGAARPGLAADLDWEQEGPQARSAAVVLPATGRTGFTLLSPEQTGVVFTNVLPESRYLTNQIYLNGSGVAAGDVDGDGLVDLFFCGLAGGSRLYRNLGNWKFEDITMQAGVACPALDATGAMLADLDGDGALDLVVNSIGGGTHIFFNDGKGRFKESALNPGLNASRGGTSLAVADFDGDGALDLYIGNYRTSTFRDWDAAPITRRMINGKPVVVAVNGRPLTDPDLTNRFVFSFIPIGGGRELLVQDENGEPDLLCRNDGHGRFTPLSWTDGAFLDEDGQPLPTPPFDLTLSVMFRDLNGDGWPDLYTSSDFSTPDRIWMNDGHGRLRAIPRLAIRHTPLSSMGLDVADINRDGYDDIFVLDMMSRDHRIRYKQRLDFVPGLPPMGVIDSRPQYTRNMLYLNRGDGTYTETALASGLEAADWAWTPLFLDVDLDGYEDLLVANGFERDNMNVDVLNQLRSLQAGADPAEKVRLRRMFPRFATPKLAFRNLGNLRFAEVGREWGFAHPGVSQGMIAADLDNDGDLDIVINNLNGPAFLLRNEIVAPRLAVRLKGQAPNTHGIGGVIRVLGGPVPQSQQIVAGGRYCSSDDAMRTFACGHATDLTVEVAWRSGRRSVLNHARPNRIYEIAEPAAVSTAPPSVTRPPLPLFEDVSARLGHAHAEEPFGDFGRQPLLPYRLSEWGCGATWFDIDGDGWDDLVLGSGKGGQLAVFRNEGGGAFTRLLGAPFTQPVTRDQTTLLGWRKPDGQTTLLAGSSNYKDGLAAGGAVRCYDLRGRTVEDLIPGQPSSSGPLAMADIEGDGQLDLFVGGRVVPGRYPEPASSLLFRGQDGRFIADADNSAQLAKVGLVTGAVFSDLDGDGYPELILACEWGPIRIFHNDHGKLIPWDWNLTLGSPFSALSPQPSALKDLTGWWTGVTVGDFDGDGRMDIVASNWGRNTKYESWRAQPLRLYYGDFAGTGNLDLLMAYFDVAMNKLVPTEHYDRVSAAMPMVQAVTGTWTAYANAGVQALVGEKLGQALELQANCLETTLFLNRGDRFQAVELPIEAQLAPAFAVCVGDLDGDGNEDVFLSQNFFQVYVDTSRYDGGRGLWLRGDGEGGFRPVPGQESGLLAYGEQRGAALCDYDADGRVDLVLTQNLGPTLLYHNVSARPGLRVRLAGPAGNPQGVGAVLRLGDGSGRWGPAREIHAGSGYWSQDSAVQVMCAAFVPRQIQVRWPGGKVTVSDLPAGARGITIDQTGQVARKDRPPL
jgi:enediyne biosynthesis protein E4